MLGYNPQGPDRQQPWILDKRLASRPYVLGDRPTIADLSLVAYLYYPPEEFGFDIAAEHSNIAAWLERIKSLGGDKRNLARRIKSLPPGGIPTT